MPPIAFKGCFCTGHHCFHPRPSVQGSPNVFVNGIEVHRVTDLWGSHCCGVSCHTGTLKEGSTTVYANGLNIGRIGDPVDCGSYVVTGSPDTFAGG